MTSAPSIHILDFKNMMNVHFVKDNKIQCIKHFRHMTNMGLREAKDFLENEWIPFVEGGNLQPSLPSESNLQKVNRVRIDQLEERVHELETKLSDLTSINNKRLASTILEDGD